MLLAAEPCQHVFLSALLCMQHQRFKCDSVELDFKKRRKGGRKGGGKKGKKEEEYLVRKLALISNILLSMSVHWENNLFHAQVYHIQQGKKTSWSSYLSFSSYQVSTEKKLQNKDIKQIGHVIQHPSETPGTFLTSDTGAHTWAQDHMCCAYLTISLPTISSSGREPQNHTVNSSYPHRSPIVPVPTQEPSPECFLGESHNFNMQGQ